ncbi:hypothetical protein ACDW_22680 [Acidovorax sp. DW039]|uniref:hypothetical protein n=1 Tax=Acidovorax sp. DW039 TaxID=3095606 RepID=UPI003093015E|nr:hypothetical protein ACDW_22680 [Acidovorax sp. DW039]
MSATWEASIALRLAHLQASIARADQGSAPSAVCIYSTNRPGPGQPHTDTPQAVITLAKPCAALIGGALVWIAADPAGAMVMQGGLPRWAEWLAGDGTLLARCNVTDMDHDGGLRVVGGATPPGETSPMLYAGGLVQIGVVALT